MMYDVRVVKVKSFGGQGGSYGAFHLVCALGSSISIKSRLRADMRFTPRVPEMEKKKNKTIV